MTSIETSHDSLIGRVVAERYRIDRRIARGGMGVVYVAEHLRLQKPVVFKVLSEHLADDEKAAARFEQEALGLSRLSHPNIVGVFDFGTEEGLTYIVMEFVPGLTLSQLLRRDGGMTFDRLLPLAVQIVQAIGAAHEKDIVHRDIKPANIMVVSEDGYPDLVKVLDFGLARLTSSSLDITKDNLVGTVSYVAPEVVKGSRAGKAADVYALGVMFYFVLTGRKPFKAEDDLSVLYKHVHDDPTPMTQLLPGGHDVPLAFVELVHRCMAKAPEDRPADGNALLAELSDVVSLPSLPRVSSGEFLEIQRAAARANAKEVPAADEPVVGTPEPTKPDTAARPLPSVELSSVGLRERPNSRWGIPLIALCVFLAGATAILVMSDREDDVAAASEEIGGVREVARDPNAPESNAAVSDVATAQEGVSDTLKADGGPEMEASKDVVGGAADNGRDPGGDRPAPGGKSRLTGAAKHDSGRKMEKRATVVGDDAKPPTTDDDRAADEPTETANPAETGGERSEEQVTKSPPPGEVDSKGNPTDDVPTLPTNSGDPGLLQVDDSADRILLPVD